MSEKYLDKEGVQILWNKVKGQIANSSGGSSSIPTVDLNLEGGTLTDEQLGIVKNNRIVNFRIAQGGNTSMYCVCIKQEIKTGSTSVYAFTSTNTPLSNVFTIAIIEASKTYQLSRSEIIYDVGFNDTQDKINLLGDGNVEIGNGIPLDTLKEKLGITGGTGGDFEIPTITLTPTSADPISGTLSEEDYTTIQNNNIIKFIVPNMVDAIVSKQVFLQDMFMFFFLIGNTIYNLLIESNKSFSISQTQLPLGMRITDNNLGVYDDAGNLMGGTVSKAQMQEWLEIGSGGSSIPEITLIPTSMDPVSGTFTDEEVQIIQNNDVIKFEVPGFAAGTATKISNLSSGSIGFAWVDGGFITYWFDIDGKEYTVRNYTLLVKDEFPIPQSLTVAANKIYLQISGGKTLGSGISAEQIINIVGKPYTISEDPEDSGTLLITENW